MHEQGTYGMECAGSNSPLGLDDSLKVPILRQCSRYSPEYGAVQGRSLLVNQHRCRSSCAAACFVKLLLQYFANDAHPKLCKALLRHLSACPLHPQM